MISPPTIAARMAGVEDPWDVLVTGIRAALDAATEPAVMRISLLDAPAVLGWREWRDIEARYGLGLVAAGLRNAMDFSRQPSAPDPQPLRTDCRGSIWNAPPPES